MSKDARNAGDVAIPDPDVDETMVVDSGRKRGVDTSPSKMRRSEDKPVTETMLQETLKRCLAEQCQMILEAQRTAVSDALQNFEHKQDKKLDDKLGKVEGKLRQMESKIQALESKHDSASTTAASSGDGGYMDGRPSDRTTVIVGGWPRDTKRSCILEKLKSVIQDLDLAKDIDREPFVTGPRRSYALLPFLPRRGEHRDECRERMYKVVNAIVRAKLFVPHQDRPLRAGIFSLGEGSCQALRSSTCCCSGVQRGQDRRPGMRVREGHLLDGGQQTQLRHLPESGRRVQSLDTGRKQVGTLDQS